MAEDDCISLTLPGGARYATVARIVVGGLAARLNLSYESLDDLQLAVESVLTEPIVRDGSCRLELTVSDGRIAAEVGPVDPAATGRALAGEDPLGLDVVLNAVVDSVELVERDGDGWLRLEKLAPGTPRT